MLKIEELFYSIQIRNHLKLLTESNLLPNASKEKLKEAKELIRKIDNLVIDSSSIALKEMEEKVNPIQKVIGLQQDELPKTSDVVSESLQNLPKVLTGIIGEQKISVTATTPEELWQKSKKLQEVSVVELKEKMIVNVENELKKTPTTKEKRAPKTKSKMEIVVEPEGRLEAVTMQDFTAPQSLSEVQRSGKKGIFRRKN
jgi:hypothetical protein